MARSALLSDSSKAGAIAAINSTLPAFDAESLWRLAHLLEDEQRKPTNSYPRLARQRSLPPATPSPRQHALRLAFLLHATEGT